jgi:hypothetical protein
VTKLGRLVKAGKIKSMEEIYLHSLPIKEYQIVDFFLPKLKDEVMKVCSDTTGYIDTLRSMLICVHRSSQFRNRLVLVSVPASRPSWLLVTARVTLALASRPPRKSRLPSAPLSSLRSSPLCPSVVATGAPTSVSRIRSRSRRAASVVPLPSG